jgi:two-component system sensor histidine kinase PilS (NtrC family)
MSASIAPGSAVAGFETTGATTDRDFPWRILSLLNVFRCVIGMTLYGVFLFVSDPPIVGDAIPALAAPVLLAIIGCSAVEFFLLRQRWPGIALHVYGQFAFDLITLILLLHASGGIQNNISGLLIVWVGTLALLVPLDRALLLAAFTTFALFGERALSTGGAAGGLADYYPTATLAAIIFVIIAVVQLLRRQIVETEALAEQRGVDLQNLVELNEYVIQHLRESIVVVDADNRIRLLNESGAKLLGVRASARDRRLGELAPTLEAKLTRWRNGAEQAAETTFVLESDQNATSIQPHFARLGRDRHEGVAIFLEDTSLILERVQQTKLAALGRLSASIAHEIRNPLGALSHAGQLLAESKGLGPDDRRLTDIIRVNSERVSRIVESVLSLSRSDKTRPQRIELKAWLEDFANEFIETQELYEGAIAVSASSLEIEVEIDRTHLHQVLWNLCDNAVKYASAAAGAIAVELYCGVLDPSGRPFLDVMDSGPGVAPELAEQIFEPFYTAQPGGTGLGLYISRELCERNGASLRYHARAEGGSVFRIVFPDPKRWQVS